MEPKKEEVLAEYLGHSCFSLAYAGQRIVLDPYADGSVPGLEPVRTDAEFVFCSHEHDDHNGVQGVRLTEPAPEPAFRVTELPVDHDHHGGSRRGKNIIRIFDFGALRVAHLGDLGRPLTAEEAKTLSGLDLVMIPVGGYYTIDAAEAKQVLEQIAPRVAVLMHYRTDGAGYDVIAHIDDALKTLGPVSLLPGSSCYLDKDTPSRTVLLQQKNKQKT